jgi:hypothetical protein
VASRVAGRIHARRSRGGGRSTARTRTVWAPPGVRRNATTTRGAPVHAASEAGARSASAGAPRKSTATAGPSRSGTWSMSIATQPPRARVSRAGTRAPSGGASFMPCAPRVFRMNASNPRIEMGFTTTRRSSARAIAHAASSQLPVCDAARTAPLPSASASSRRRRDSGSSAHASASAVVGRRESQSSSITLAPSARYTPRAQARGSPTPALSSDATTCARRTRRTDPKSHAKGSPSARSQRNGMRATTAASAPRQSSIIRPSSRAG